MSYPKPSATLHRLRTKPERLKRDQGEQLRLAVLKLAEALDVPDEAVSRVIAAIDRQTAADEDWAFNMISPKQNRAVVRWLRENSSRPLVAVDLWAALFEYIRRDTGEIVATRKELAKDVGVTPNHISQVMGELTRINAIVRHRDGREVRYFMNPLVGTKLGGLEREQAQKVVGPLRLV